MNKQKITAGRVSAGSFVAGILLILVKAPHSFDVGVFFIIVAAAILGWDRRRWLGMISGILSAIAAAMALISLNTGYSLGALPAWAFLALLSIAFAFAAFRRIK